MPAHPSVEDIRDWAGEMGVAGRRLAGQFSRSGPRRRVVKFLRGLSADSGYEDA